MEINPKPCCCVSQPLWAWTRGTAGPGFSAWAPLWSQPLAQRCVVPASFLAVCLSIMAREDGARCRRLEIFHKWQTPVTGRWGRRELLHFSRGTGGHWLSGDRAVAFWVKMACARGLALGCALRPASCVAACLPVQATGAVTQLRPVA